MLSERSIRFKPCHNYEIPELRSKDSVVSRNLLGIKIET